MNSAVLAPAAPPLAANYTDVRAKTEALCAPLAIEDYVVQSMPDASPVKWHLAHTTWFFETFVLQPFARDYRSYHPGFGTLFNSYYESVGPQHARPERGLLTRPTVSEIYAYRRHVDEAVQRVLDREEVEPLARVALGIEHEQQHQELLLTDLQHAFWRNPLLPVYKEVHTELYTKPRDPPISQPTPRGLRTMGGGIVAIGASGKEFAFDNERPRHNVVVEPFALATRCVTQGEYLDFVDAKGYERPEFWLSDGYAFVRDQNVRAPLYWYRQEGQWHRFSLHGTGPLDLDAPVCHVSYYEADAFARWAKARLPTEMEWECAHAELPVRGHFLEEGHYLPRTCESGFGSVWTWTASPYTAYPGFRAEAGALGEYNGKFMANQWVLRGGSCFTPAAAVRATYRNFFPPTARWQVSGIRLARDDK